ncbi:hypothetical protein MSG28_013002 [Choristoneura fumiferana]|uniref:Uncharacterized protein n=1 Tax=Choristoneura fumiferana TaxID=7141 RepID=A0ACC0KS71_CHOFU|nr:hypothetical protein MSG28_013002 [Choristoneura fumiferana]
MATNKINEKRVEHNVNPVLNAVVDQRFEEALKEAQEIDKQIQSVPFTAKDSHAVRGLVHSLGIAARAHVRASDDAECVRLLRAAGALPVAVTNHPEDLAPLTKVVAGDKAKHLNLDRVVDLKVVAAPRQDALCLAVAQHLNEHFGGYRPPCTILH